MTVTVKAFIEENIDSIEHQDWRTLFLSWYLHWKGATTEIDNKLLAELFEILEEAYPNIIYDSRDARSTIILDKMCDIIRTNLAVLSYVSVWKTKRDLSSRLFFDNADLKLLFSKAATSLGLSLDNDNTFATRV